MWSALASGTEYIPCVVVNLNQDDINSKERLEEALSSWTKYDDVTSPLFTSTRILLQRSPGIDTQDDEQQLPAGVNTVQICSYRNGQKSNTGVREARLEVDGGTVTGVQSGPHFCSRLGLHNTFRVFENFQDAFLSAIRQESLGQSLGFHEERPVSYIPVPSRIYTLSTSSRLPLSGLRFIAKDVFNIEGLRKSVGSRAFYSFHPPCSKTAPAVQALIDNGAILVGKTKNTQFANGEDPQEWIDYSRPWNPRGMQSLERANVYLSKH